MRIKNACFCVFLFAVVLLNLGIIYATNKNNEKINNYFRLHVVANSDSIDDQMLKLKVSKALQEYVNEIIKECNTKTESKDKVTKNIYNILNLCKNVINENNDDYLVKAYIGNIEYDFKSYNELEFEKGIYDSLKIVIGDGKGTNWWSLIYPATVNLDEYEFKEYTFSFKIVEIIQNLFNKEEGLMPSSL